MKTIRRNRLCLLLVLLVLYSCSANQQSLRKDVSGLSPYEYGLAEAISDVERYNVLYRTHVSAIKSGTSVDYHGISKIYIEIPEKSKPIPLCLSNDFCNCTINVKSLRKEPVFLFETVQEGNSIVLSGAEIDGGMDSAKKYRLDSGLYLVVINDRNPWVENRTGYGYGHIRKDILLIKDGNAVNSVVSTYNNAESSPSCTIIKAQNKPLHIKNLTVNRDEQSMGIVNIFNISGYNDVRMSSICINTPKSKLHNDRAVKICNSTNVSLKDITINGTYSQVNESGYGFYLDNIWNFTGEKLYCDGNWGVFGNNNINHATIIDSKINRFDVHCYGRDMFFKRVHFFNLHNQFSSVYGEIRFEDCMFENSTPLINGTSYNAYVPYDVYFKNCVLNTTTGKNYILKLGVNDGVNNRRSELEEKCWPNIHIKDFIVNLSDDVQHFYIITNKEGDVVQDLGYITEIEIDGLSLKTNNSRFKGVWMSKMPMHTKHLVKCHVSNVVLNCDGNTIGWDAAGNQIQIKAAGNNVIFE